MSIWRFLRNQYSEPVTTTVEDDERGFREARRNQQVIINQQKQEKERRQIWELWRDLKQDLQELPLNQLQPVGDSSFRLRHLRALQQVFSKYDQTLLSGDKDWPHQKELIIKQVIKSLVNELAAYINSDKHYSINEVFEVWLILKNIQELWPKSSAKEFSYEAMSEQLYYRFKDDKNDKLKNTIGLIKNILEYPKNFISFLLDKYSTIDQVSDLEHQLPKDLKMEVKDILEAKYLEFEKDSFLQAIKETRSADELIDLCQLYDHPLTQEEAINERRWIIYTDQVRADLPDIYDRAWAHKLAEQFQSKFIELCNQIVATWEENQLDLRNTVPYEEFQQEQQRKTFTGRLFADLTRLRENYLNRIQLYEDNAPKRFRLELVLKELESKKKVSQGMIDLLAKVGNN